MAAARRLLTALAWLLALAAAPVHAAELRFPALTGRVVDAAGLLSPAGRDRIAGWLAGFETASGRQVVVATVPSLQGVPIETYGYQLGRAWGIGQAGRNTGAILLVAPAERAVRIEVGYGLEGELTDAVSRTIIDRDILPAFRQGEFERGIAAGTAAMLRALGWTGAAAAPDDDGGNVDWAPLGFLLLILVFAILRHGRHGLWIIPMGHDVWSSGQGGGGGFSGGGGSFGGGGASGRW